MATRIRPFDKIIFGAIVALTAGGFLIFMSASLGLLTRSGAAFQDVAVSQLLLGIVGGGIALVINSLIPYRFWRRAAIFIFGIAVVLALLVYMPGIGLELKGAHRWIDLGFTTFQPSEALKVAYVLLLAALLSKKRTGPMTFRTGLVPFGIVTAIVAVLLLTQPDMGTFLITLAAGTGIFIAAGARLKDLGVLAIVGIIMLGTIIAVRPYALDRITTFLDPSRDPQGAGYQLKQSLIAVGSGEILGRGFGQSIQKFNYLPEPIGDSIFAVYVEEFGFVGGLILLLAFVTFGLRGLWVSTRAPDLFGGLVAVGIVILIMAHSFLNIGSMLGVFPLTGVPLVFISHGGSALFMALAASGILLNISRARRIG